MVGIVLISLCAFLAGCAVEADFSGSLPLETLSAEEYQQEIAAIDRLLFAETPLGESGVESLVSRLEELAARVGRHSDALFLQIEARELRLLAKLASRVSPDATGGALRNDWMRIRNNLFDDRHWFARSEADLAYAASVVPPPKEKEETHTDDDHSEVEDRKEQESLDDGRPRVGLSGCWRVTSMNVNGFPAMDAELSGSVWCFEGQEIVVRGGNGVRKRFNFAVESEFLAVTTESGDEGWIRWEADETWMTLAFIDGLGAKPVAFTQRPGTGAPPLITLRLTAVE
jgi:hypothetical protein